MVLGNVHAVAARAGMRRKPGIELATAPPSNHSTGIVLGISNVPAANFSHPACT